MSLEQTLLKAKLNGLKVFQLTVGIKFSSSSSSTQK